MKAQHLILILLIYMLSFGKSAMVHAQSSEQADTSLHNELKSDIDKLQAKLDQNEQEKQVRLQTIRARILNGEDFCTLAKEFSEDATAANCGDMGGNELANLSLEYAATVVRLKAGQVSEVIRTESGFHLLQLVEIKDKKYFTRHILIK